jgi:hypothetical protein
MMGHLAAVRRTNLGAIEIATATQQPIPSGHIQRI